MKNMKKNKMIIIPAIIVVLSILLMLASNYYKNHNKVDLSKYEGGIYISSEEYVSPDLVLVTNSKMKREKCLDGICVRGVVIEIDGNSGQVKYKIRNTTKKTKSGILKLVFDNISVLAIYDDLESGKTVESFSSFTGIDLRNEKDYELKNITDEEYLRLEW